MSEKSLIYICSGRSFSSASPGRKIFGVINCWQKIGYRVEHISGADLLAQQVNSNKEYGAVSHYKKWYRKPFLSFFTHSLSELRDYFHDKKMLKKILKVNEKQPVNIIWERSSRLHIAGLIAARNLNKTFVLEWKDHLIPYKFSLLKLYAEYIEKVKVEKADFIVVESEVLKNFLIDRYHIDAQKIIVAYNAVDSEEFKPSKEKRLAKRSELNFSDSDFVVGYVGSYAFYHDCIRLVKAASLIKESNIKFLLVGAGKEYSLVYEEAKKLGLLNEVVFFHPPVPKEEVPQLLSSMDAAVLPGSTDIICPIKVQEYMSFGLPPIVPDYACNREVINKSNGVLFKPFDEHDLSEVIKNLEKKPEWCKELGAAARQSVEDHFSWEATWGAALNHVSGH